MKVLSWIMLIVGLILVTILTTSTIEHFSPGSISWVMTEIDWWYAKIWGGVLFIVFLSTAIAVVGWIIFKFGPQLLKLIKTNLPFIMVAVQKMQCSPKWRGVLTTVGVILFICFLLGLIIAGIWIFSLFFL